MKDIFSIFTFLVINVAGWAAGITALLGVLPIPHSAHDWGLTLGSAVLFVLGRLRDGHNLRKRLRAAPVVPPVADVPVPRATRRAHAKALGVPTHSKKARKSAKR